MRFREDSNYKDTTDYETRESRQAAVDSLESIEKVLIYSTVNQDVRAAAIQAFGKLYSAALHT